MTTGRKRNSLRLFAQVLLLSSLFSHVGADFQLTVSRAHCGYKPRLTWSILQPQEQAQLSASVGTLSSRIFPCLMLRDLAEERGWNDTL